jgi:hypothetical protein
MEDMINGQGMKLKVKLAKSLLKVQTPCSLM